LFKEGLVPLSMTDSLKKQRCALQKEIILNSTDDIAVTI